MQPSSPSQAPHITLHLNDEAATLRTGTALARALVPGTVMYLQGDLGAGKTTLARGILQGLGYQGKVKSPSYSLVEVYSVFNLNLYHFDLYRFKNAVEWEDSGFGEHCDGHSICLIEWPEKAFPLLPPADVRIDLTEHAGARQLHAVAMTSKGKPCIDRLSIHERHDN